VVTFYTLDSILISGLESLVLKFMSVFEITFALINGIDMAFFIWYGGWCTSLGRIFLLDITVLISKEVNCKPHIVIYVFARMSSCLRSASW
jgi:hypothetical protein